MSAPPIDASLWLLPNANTVDPKQTSGDAQHTWYFPFACVLTAAKFHGKAATIGSTNTLGTSGVPKACDVDVFINGVFATTLFTIPAGATDVDLSAAPNLEIPENAEVWFVVVAPTIATITGAMIDFLLAFDIEADPTGGGNFDTSLQIVLAGPINRRNSGAASSGGGSYLSVLNTISPG